MARLKNVANGSPEPRDRISFNLEADNFEQFTAILDAPPAPNPGFDRSLAINLPWYAGSP